jgi:mannose-6-phosphate isomerase-like protein (cupin superfamily)
VVISTGGLELADIDKLVSFFSHRNVDFALMHCVAIYPTPMEQLNLERITALRQRYPNLQIGYSTHEDPDNLDAVKMAIAKGAVLQERHVGVETDEIKLNKYSSRPEQIDAWLGAAKEAWEACKFEPAPPAERASLDSLQRGIYLKRAVKKGEELKREDVFFAIPFEEGQMPSGKWKEGLKSYFGGFRDTSIIADKDYEENEALADQEFSDASSGVFEVIHGVKGLLHEARIAIGDEFSVELSHHYGPERIKEFGAVIIDCINREYCKKLIVQVAGQKHPMHYHKVKEETFQVLHGDLEVEINGEKKTLGPGDQLLVERGAPHSFTTKNGVVVEEVSTTHVKNDSYYDDESIAKMKLEDRKTKFDLW